MCIFLASYTSSEKTARLLCMRGSLFSSVLISTGMQKSGGPGQLDQKIVSYPD